MAKTDRAAALAEWDRWYDSRPKWVYSIKVEGIWWWIEKARNPDVEPAVQTDELEEDL